MASGEVAIVSEGGGCAAKGQLSFLGGTDLGRTPYLSDCRNLTDEA
jgi:hypothetical protein